MSKILRPLTVFLLVFGLAAVAGCGRKGKIQYLPGEKPPQEYPSE
ncbi:MAG: lipoprotein [Magnetospirillum sp. WYHS-4]